MSFLTEGIIKELQTQGWDVWVSRDELSYKSHWNSPWFFVREFFQNALDEHDEAGIMQAPEIQMSPAGLVIKDSGRGIGAEALLLRETKPAVKGLRGRFGEGLKWGCLVAVRMGYTPVIESPLVTIKAYAIHRKVGRVEVDLMVYVTKENGGVGKGTKITVEGYRGETYKDRFVTFLGKPILEFSTKVGEYTRKFAIFEEPPNRFYSGDIFVREFDVRKSKYSYNLWEVELNPDRVAEVSNSRLSQVLCFAWSVLSSKDMAVKFLQAITDMTKEESRMSDWNVTWSQAAKKAAQEAWNSLYGKAVLYTDPNWTGSAIGYGIKVVGQNFTHEARAILQRLGIPTDKQSSLERDRQLGEYKVVPDSELSSVQRAHLKLLRFITSKITFDREALKTITIEAAKIPEAYGLWEGSNLKMLIHPDSLTTLEGSLSVYYHELGHGISWDAEDATTGHTKGVQEAGMRGSLVIMREKAAVAEILSILEEKADIVSIDKKYTTSQLLQLAKVYKVSPSGDKKDIIRRLLEKGLIA